MGYDKVVDSAALDAAMIYTANRIRNKTGGTDQIAWDSDKGFGDAVDSIQPGGSFFENLQTFQISPVSTMTEIVANIPNVTTLYCFLGVGRDNVIERVELTVSNKLTSLERLFNNMAPKNFKEIIFHGDLSGVTNMSLAFGCGGTGANRMLKKITGLDFTSVTNAGGAFGSQWGIEDLEIKANTINISLAIGSKSLTVDSCVNVLNALKDRTDIDALTLTLDTVLTNASTGTLYTNYVKLNADTGLYVLCEQTDNGAMTIADAIVAKNWTIA